MEFLRIPFSSLAVRQIIEKLEEFGIPFADVGMGICETDGALGGILRVTTGTPQKRDHVRAKIPFSDGGVGRNEYAANIQIAELNALNAALAVLKWSHSRTKSRAKRANITYPDRAAPCRWP